MPTTSYFWLLQYHLVVFVAYSIQFHSYISIYFGSHSPHPPITSTWLDEAMVPSLDDWKHTWKNIHQLGSQALVKRESMMLLVSGCFFDNDSKKKCVYQKIIYNSFPFVSKQSETPWETRKKKKHATCQQRGPGKSARWASRFSSEQLKEPMLGTSWNPSSKSKSVTSVRGLIWKELKNNTSGVWNDKNTVLIWWGVFPSVRSISTFNQPFRLASTSAVRVRRFQRCFQGPKVLPRHPPQDAPPSAKLPRISMWTFFIYHGTFFRSIGKVVFFGRLELSVAISGTISMRRLLTTFRTT